MSFLCDCVRIRSYTRGSHVMTSTEDTNLANGRHTFEKKIEHVTLSGAKPFCQTPLRANDLRSKVLDGSATTFYTKVLVTRRSRLLLKCCFTSTETVGLLGTGAQDVHLDFHTAPEL